MNENNSNNIALCFGSMNIDKIYSVDHFPSPGETISCSDYKVCAGGKGLNQAIALSNAGVRTYMAGCICPEDSLLIDTLQSRDVNIDYIVSDPKFISGHAIIQIDKSGQNAITVFRGANLCVTKEQIDNTLQNFRNGDYLLLQNEIKNIGYIVEKAYSIGMKIVLNPSPMRDNILKINFNKLSFIILNEIEIVQLLYRFFSENDDQEIRKKFHPKNFLVDTIDNAKLALKALNELFPNLKIILTLGEEGSIFYDGYNFVCQKAYKTKVVDTTAAGDTYTGYFCAGLLKGKDIKSCMDEASKASSFAVSKLGASASIPKI